MKTRTASLSLLTILCLMLAVAPAMADTLYSNGPINGTTDAWTINMQDGQFFAVTDSFTCFYWSCRVTDLHIGVWVVWGDTMTSVQMDIGTSSFGTDKFSGVLTATGSTDLGLNQYGVDIQQIDFEFPYIELGGYETYWLTLSNAVAPSGDTIYWDENSGIGCQSWGCPSTAYQTINGSIPSEAFTLTGTYCYWCGGTTPEPSSIILFGSGMLGLVGVLRRKLSR
jgi:hypothetical protein